MNSKAKDIIRKHKKRKARQKARRVAGLLLQKVKPVKKSRKKLYEPV